MNSDEFEDHGQTDMNLIAVLSFVTLQCFIVTVVIGENISKKSMFVNFRST